MNDTLYENEFCILRSIQDMRFICLYVFEYMYAYALISGISAITTAI